jgi:hypothetical protein
MTNTGQQLHAGWVEFLLRFRWSHCLHLTTRYANTKERLEAEFRRLVRRLERVTQGPLGGFLALEKTTDGHLHAHALIAGSESLPVKRLEKAWEKGFSRIHRVRRRKAVIRYATKWATQNSEDYVLVGRLERHLHSLGEDN